MTVCPPMESLSCQAGAAECTSGDIDIGRYHNDLPSLLVVMDTLMGHTGRVIAKSRSWILEPGARSTCHYLP